MAVIEVGHHALLGYRNDRFPFKAGGNLRPQKRCRNDGAFEYSGQLFHTGTWPGTVSGPDVGPGFTLLKDALTSASETAITGSSEALEIHVGVSLFSLSKLLNACSKSYALITGHRTVQCLMAEPGSRSL